MSKSLLSDETNWNPPMATAPRPTTAHFRGIHGFITTHTGAAISPLAIPPNNKQTDSPFDGEHAHLVTVLGEAPDRLGMQEATEEHDQPTAKPEDHRP